MAAKPKFVAPKAKKVEAPSTHDRDETAGRKAADEAKKKISEYVGYTGHDRSKDPACDDQIGEMGEKDTTAGYERKASSSTLRVMATCGDCAHYNKNGNVYLWFCPFYRKPRPRD